jgi:hypothetical protein
MPSGEDAVSGLGHPLGEYAEFPLGTLRKSARLPRSERPWSPNPGKPFIARYRGVCKICHQAISVGDVVRRNPDGPGAVHKICPLTLGGWKSRQEHTPGP